MPLFVRRGGVVLSAPQRESTGTPIWPELVVDAFAPTDDQEQTRELYEDDGMTTAHERGECVRTAIGLRQVGDRTEVRLAPGPQARRVTVRIHLPPDVRPVSAGGKILKPTNECTVLPFAGPGTPPPVEAGPIWEWRGEIAPTQEACVAVVARRQGKLSE
ncbi:MAG TPA: DUF5110 domain-containing protein [Kiritimatiellia bacterium]|nr:DUF5110 domain-containing protein [Kiritimatiellia bacterium]